MERDKMFVVFYDYVDPARGECLTIEVPLIMPRKRYRLSVEESRGFYERIIERFKDGTLYTASEHPDNLTIQLGDDTYELSPVEAAYLGKLVSVARGQAIKRRLMDENIEDVRARMAADYRRTRMVNANLGKEMLYEVFYDREEFGFRPTVRMVLCDGVPWRDALAIYRSCVEDVISALVRARDYISRVPGTSDDVNREMNDAFLAELAQQSVDEGGYEMADDEEHAKVGDRLPRMQEELVALDAITDEGAWRQHLADADAWAEAAEYDPSS